MAAVESDFEPVPGISIGAASGASFTSRPFKGQYNAGSYLCASESQLFSLFLSLLIGRHSPFTIHRPVGVATKVSQRSPLRPVRGDNPLIISFGITDTPRSMANDVRKNWEQDGFVSKLTRCERKRLHVEVTEVCLEASMTQLYLFWHRTY